MIDDLKAGLGAYAALTYGAPLARFTSSCNSSQKAICEQLDRILHSTPFQHSLRRQRFLEFIVSETLAGRSVKGYDVGLEVFGRPETFDPTMDPVVRVEAGRLRDKRREYYGADGEGDPIRIDLAKGTYTPQIKFRHEDAPQIGPQKGPPTQEVSQTISLRSGSSV